MQIFRSKKRHGSVSKKGYLGYTRVSSASTYFIEMYYIDLRYLVINATIQFVEQLLI